jgi:sigma-B regulation protein RsbU (phosphoserine phosphatase)
MPTVDKVTIRALVVDDDPLIRSVLGVFLGARGYGVEHCADGASALARVQAGGVNLVLTDRNMPGMDGLALSRAIRALPTQAYVYCVMLTASGEEQSLVDAMEAGVDDFIAKPLRLAELGARLHAAERVLFLEAGLAARNRELALAYGQLSHDLELARVLQLGQLPPRGAHGRVRFDWMFEASGYVGGDVFDFFALGARHLCFYLADVSGHGVAAAMIAFHAQHQLRASSEQLAAALARPNADVARIAVAVAEEFNRRFLEMRETSLYLTMAFGLIDVEQGHAALIHAGHPPSLHAAAGQEDYEEVGEGGVPVGILPDPGYRASCIALQPGARLVLYSDGITDCRNPAGEPFAANRLRALLQEQRQAPLAASGERLKAQVRAWRGEGAFEDDVTLLALEVH